MAEIKPRIDLSNRTPLEKVIPLDTPFLVFLDPSDVCNAQCPWCPSGNKKLLNSVGRKPRLMDFNLYRRIINDLIKFPQKIKTLRLYKDGEPLLHHKFPEMVEYAKVQDAFVEIDTTTNGLALNYELIRKIINAGLTKIFISVPRNYDEAYLNNIRYLHGYAADRCKVYAKIIGDGFDDSKKKKFIDDFETSADYVFIENLAPCWPGHRVNSNTEKGIYQQPLTQEVEVCPYIFYSMAINSNGKVSLCFLDWRHDAIIGDLNKKSAIDIWMGKDLKRYQLIHLRKKRKETDRLSNGKPWPCKNCGQLLYGAPDNIDKYANSLIRKLK